MLGRINNLNGNIDVYQFNQERLKNIVIDDIILNYVIDKLKLNYNIIEIKQKKR